MRKFSKSLFDLGWVCEDIEASARKKNLSLTMIQHLFDIELSYM